MSKTNRQRRRPTTGAKGASRPVLVRNANSADGFFMADAPKPYRGKGPDRGAMFALAA